VIVSRTFSKVFGMAGLRIGYAIDALRRSNRSGPSSLATA